jgi:hypothetical protein
VADLRTAGKKLEEPVRGPYAGAALDVYPLEVLKLKFRMLERGSREGIADQYRDVMGTDHVNAPKFPAQLLGVNYLAGGIISMRGASGEFVFASDSPKPGPGALYMNQDKSEFTSTAGTTKIGTPELKTLTGLLLNPASIRRPSSAITPQRGWVASMFPGLSRFNVAEWAMVAFIQATFWQVLGKLFKTDDKTGTTVRRDRKDLGTLIIDNQDFERRILEGEI